MSVVSILEGSTPGRLWPLPLQHAAHVKAEHCPGRAPHSWARGWGGRFSPSPGGPAQAGPCLGRPPRSAQGLPLAWRGCWVTRMALPVGSLGGAPAASSGLGPSPKPLEMGLLVEQMPLASTAQQALPPGCPPRLVWGPRAPG